MGNRKNTGRVFKFTILTLLVIALVCLSGCSGKTNAADALETTLSAIQNQDEQVINTYLSAVKFDPELLSVSKTAFTALYFSDFSYKIIDTETNKDGTVTVNAIITTEIIKNIRRLSTILYIFSTIVDFPDFKAP